MRAICVHRGGGGQKRAKNCVRTYSMPPYSNSFWGSTGMSRSVERRALFKIDDKRSDGRTLDARKHGLHVA